jgi:hypothetical protein
MQGQPVCQDYSEAPKAILWIFQVFICPGLVYRLNRRVDSPNTTFQ